MNCPNCGKEVREDAKFCSECGTRLEQQKIEEEPIILGTSTQSEEETTQQVEETVEPAQEVEETVEEVPAEPVQEVEETVEEEPVQETVEEEKNWYYVENSQSTGPFSESEMVEFIKSKKIDKDTYVWKAGMQDWVHLEKSELEEYTHEKVEEQTSNDDSGWYYVDSTSSQVGPCSEEQMKELIHKGVIQMNTYVWKAGMQDWILMKDSTLYTPNVSQQQSQSYAYNNPTGSMNKGFVQNRNIALSLILSIVTCGIYGLYWIYCLAKDVNTLCNAQNKPMGTEPGLVVVFSLVTCGVYDIYFYWKSAKLLHSLTYSNYAVEDNSLILALLQVFGLGIVSSCILQSTLNDIQKYAE